MQLPTHCKQAAFEALWLGDVFRAPSEGNAAKLTDSPLPQMNLPASGGGMSYALTSSSKMFDSDSSSAVPSASIPGNDEDTDYEKNIVTIRGGKDEISGFQDASTGGEAEIISNQPKLNTGPKAKTPSGRTVRNLFEEDRR
ncbi:MAG: hypothetical protein H7070_05270 [Saprospiraceae bacterium]|nr:hypothetical protein [Pyrinomonadaceae bacterium]